MLAGQGVALAAGRPAAGTAGSRPRSKNALRARDRQNAPVLIATSAIGLGDLRHPHPTIRRPTTSEGEDNLNPVDPTHPVPVAIIGMGCLFPKADGPGRFWANIRTRRRRDHRCSATHWRPDDYFDADPKAPDRTYARRGGFLDPGRLPAPRLRDRPQQPRSHRHHPAPRPAGRPARPSKTPATAKARRKPLDRDRVSVILGVTGTLELVIPLGARLGHPIWRRALKAPGVRRRQGRRSRPADRRLLRRLAGELVPGPARQRRRRPDRQPARPGRHQLRGRRRLRQLARRAEPRHPRTGGRPVRPRAHRRPRHVQRHLHVHVFQQDPGPVAPGRRPAVRRRGDGTILGEGLGMLVLKRLDDARRDGDRIYAVIQVGRHRRATARATRSTPRSAAGQVKALRQAYRLAGVSPDTIELVEAHGTGTKVGDATELAALERGLPRSEGRTGPGARWGRSSRRSGTPRRRRARRG